MRELQGEYILTERFYRRSLHLADLSDFGSLPVYFLNIIGPITPFLRDRLSLSYSISSLHYTAFAVGILMVGLGGQFVIERLGRWRAIWVGAIGMSLKCHPVNPGRTPVITVGASFLMGLVGL